MTDKKKNGWIKFVPSLDLPKERVSIAYDTHDERGVRYAYGYFQFYNGTCGCFWKDGNEQPKVVKAEDIKYWMPVPSLDVQEEPVSEDFEKALAREWQGYNARGAAIVDALEDNTQELAFAKGFYRGSKWKEEKFEKNRLKHCNSITNEQAELEQGFIDQHLDKYQRMPTFLDAIEYGMNLQKKQMMAKAVDATVHIDAGGYPYIPQMELYDYGKDIPLAKEGDKYKVILIKEE